MAKLQGRHPCRPADGSKAVAIPIDAKSMAPERLVSGRVTSREFRAYTSPRKRSRHWRWLLGNVRACFERNP
jgi:hypothetical protein